MGRSRDISFASPYTDKVLAVATRPDFVDGDHGTRLKLMEAAGFPPHMVTESLVVAGKNRRTALLWNLEKGLNVPSWFVVKVKP